MAGRWTVRPQDIVSSTTEGGELNMEVPVHLDGVLQFTQHTSVGASGQLEVRFVRAPGCQLHGFRAWSDF